MLPHSATDTRALCGSHFIFNKVLNHNGITLFTQQLMQPYRAVSHLAAATDAVFTETRASEGEAVPVPKDSERLPT